MPLGVHAILEGTGLIGPARRARHLARRARGTLRRGPAIARYLQAAPAARLHLGAGANVLRGWLNTDIAPTSSRVLYLDASRRFPFDDASFASIFTEHLIEHLPFEAGTAMLAECHRVLRPGGRIRVATPDIEFIRALLAPGLSDLQTRYIQWATHEFMPPGTPVDPALVVNHFVRAWGHELIYSAALLTSTLEACGFVEVTRQPVGESTVPALRDLEHEARMPNGFLALETMVFEARRPPLG